MATSPVDLKRSHFTSKTEKSSVSMFDRWGGNPFVFKRKDSAESVSMFDRWKGNPFIIEHKDGGPGSGNFGHAGRIGQRGGSAPSGISSVSDKYYPTSDSVRSWSAQGWNKERKQYLHDSGFSEGDIDEFDRIVTSHVQGSDVDDEMTRFISTYPDLVTAAASFEIKAAEKRREFEKRDADKEVTKKEHDLEDARAGVYSWMGDQDYVVEAYSRALDRAKEKRKELDAPVKLYRRGGYDSEILSFTTNRDGVTLHKGTDHEQYLFPDHEATLDELIGMGIYPVAGFGAKFNFYSGESSEITFVRTNTQNSDGGPGSGNFGHAGRPGERGGSTPGPYHKLNDRAKKLVEEHKKNPYHFGESLDQKMATRSTLVKELNASGVRVIDEGEDKEPFRFKCLDPDLSYYECTEISKALSQSIYSYADRDAYIEACRAEGEEPRLSEPAEEFPQEYLISNSGKSQTDGTPVYTSLDKEKLLSDNDLIIYSGTDKALNPEKSEKAEQATKDAVDSMSDGELSAIHGYTKQYGSATSYEINNYLATGEGTETTKKASEQLTSALDHEIGVDCITCRGASTVHGTDQDPKIRKLIDKVSRGDFSSAQQLKEMLEGKTITSNTVLSTSPNTTTSEYDQRPVQFIFKTPHNAKGVNITGVSAYGGGRSNAEKALAATGIFGSEQHEAEVAFKPGTRYTIDRVEYAVDTRGKKRKGQVYIVATIHADNDDSRTDGGPGSGNHGHKGVPGQRGGSAPKGTSPRSPKDFIPKGSYTETKSFREAHTRAKNAFADHDRLWDRREQIESALKTESRPKPKNEWDDDDEFHAIIGERPMIYTERGKELQSELADVKKQLRTVNEERDAALEDLDKFKKEAHEEQIKDWVSTRPKPAQSASYQGFTTSTTGTSYGDSLLASGKGYIAEMSPEEYLKRCAYDIFTGATIESTVNGTESKNVEKYADMMAHGTKFDLPYLNYMSQEQEGRHRALAAYMLGIEKIPVLIYGYRNTDGGEGSGNFGHEGRPGEVGGSAPSDGSPASPESAHAQGRAMMKMTKRRANDTFKELSRKGTGSDADRADAHKEAKKLLDDLPVGSVVKLPDYWNDDGTGDKLKKTDNGWLCTNNGDHYVISTDSLAEYVIGADGDEVDLPQVVTVAMSAEEKRLADEAYERSYWRNNAHIWQEDGSFDKEMTIQLHRAKDLKTCGEGFILKGSDGRDYVKYGDEWYDSETYQKADMRKLNDPKFTGDFFDINFGMNGVSAEECQRMREAYATMPEHMRSRYETAFRETTFVPSYKGVSYFDPSTGNIHFDTNADADAIVHEVAHSLDYGACSMEFTTAGYSYKRNTASSCIQELGDTTEQRSEDFAAMARIVGYETKDGWFTGKHEGVSGQSERFSVWIKFCHEHDNIPGFSLVSDCISGLTMGQCGEEFFGGGHSQEYWSSYHPRLSSSSRSVEYWAEFCALKAMGYTEALSLLKQVTPNMYDAAEKVFEEVFK